MNYFVIISTFVAKYFFHNQTNYMTFSYQLLPIWLLFTISFIHKPNLFKLGVALCMLLEGVVYGARGPPDLVDCRSNGLYNTRSC